jgi:transketolase
MDPYMTTPQQRANAIRALAMDAVQKANSGHPGAPLGMADIAEVLWHGYLQHNPANPQWANRDRFVLSNGHGSMLIYSLLHLTGYDLPMSELENFRQLGSRTPGHPEYGHTPGVETTTGPLGQGFANAVGMALAEKILAAQFNRGTGASALNIVDHYTYTFVGDGCLMEGISHEVASLAGTLGLGKLVCIYDDNGISIDGDVKGWFADDTPARFRAYGWEVIDVVDGHDAAAVRAALDAARGQQTKPTLICCQTTIGYGAPTKAGTAGSHGSPLGAEEIKGARAALGWTEAPFVIPPAISASWNALERGAELEAAWQEQFGAYQQQFPELASEFLRRMNGDLPQGWTQMMDELLETTDGLAENLASRQASAKIIAHMAEQLPELLGGSADLTGSNLTSWPSMRPVSHDQAGGNYIYYGVREFGMTAITNGLALHGGFLPFSGTFLVFMDYARNAVRMAALMGLRNVLVYTHDSIGQGEDGPTHQPVEHIANLRGTPNMSVWRPADGVETVAAWRAAVERNQGPTALVLSRQGLPHISRQANQLADVRRGGYVLRGDVAVVPQLIIIATGSEVSLAVKAYDVLAEQGITLRVVSMPSADVFAAQEQAYRDSVLPPACRARLAVESAHVDYWWKWVGLDGQVLGLTTFGESGPGPAVLAHFGFTVDNVVKLAKGML